MINSKQSNKRNSFKNSRLAPLLIIFIFIFQTETNAQVKDTETAIPFKQIKNSNGTENNTTSVKNEDAGYIFDKITSDSELESNFKSIKEKYKIDMKVSKLKRNLKGEIIAIKLSYNDNKGQKGQTEQLRSIAIRPIFMKIKVNTNGKNEIGFFDNHTMTVLPKDDEKERKISVIENLADNATIFVDKMYMTKEDVEYLDVNSLVSIEIVNDLAKIKSFQVGNKKEIVVINTNWENQILTNNYEIVFIEAIGDVILYEKNALKIPNHPVIKITSTFPELIVNNKMIENPAEFFKNHDFLKMNSIQYFNSNGSFEKDSELTKVIITTSP